jgi:CheY-like chemotaxis protein
MARRVLVVDDIDLNRRLAVALLRRDGWEVAEAEDGDEALVKLDGASFDAVLLDISMPRMSGDAVCRRLREQPRHDRLAVVAYTAHAMVEDRENMLAAGFDGILIKPINAEILRQTLAAALEKRAGG